MKGMVLHDDKRYAYMAEYLKARGHRLYEDAQGLDFVVFYFKRDVERELYGDEFFLKLNKDAKVFSGIRNPYLEEKCTKHKLNYYAMMDDDGVKIKNAVPTSEGVIAYAISNSAKTIAGSRALIIGYGVCGRDLARRFAALGAEVHALVKGYSAECSASADMVMPIYIGDLDIGRYDFVINTVPMRVLDNKTVQNAQNALIIDIASAPYGIDMELAQSLNKASALLPGIPGKYAVRTAGEILGEYIDYKLSGGGGDDD